MTQGGPHGLQVQEEPVRTQEVPLVDSGPVWTWGFASGLGRAPEALCHVESAHVGSSQPTQDEQWLEAQSVDTAVCSPAGPGRGGPCPAL